jgi:type IV secretory pathway VirJ component
VKSAVIAVAAVILGLPSLRALPVFPSHETDHFGRFGSVAIYRLSPHPRNVVLFISGDGGWNLGVIDMAVQLSDLDSFVVGIDINHYRRAMAASHEKCSYSAADFEALSQYLQKKYGFPRYIPPVLVGYSSGATLAYALLVQAPRGTFEGAISMGFCPDLEMPKPLCRGYGLEWKMDARHKSYVFLPDAKLNVPWIAFQGTVDKVCDYASVEAFVKRVGSGRIVLLPKVGHGFAVTRNWSAQFKEAFNSLVERRVSTASPPESADINGLPLEPIPSRINTSDEMAILVSGDGGWAGLDRDIGAALARRGIPVVGWNSLQYFWTRRTPAEAALDLEHVILYYLAEWHKEKVLLIGYSRGADVLPFMVNRLPDSLLPRIRLLALIGPSQSVDFEFHLSEWLGEFSHRNDLPVLPEVEKLTVKNVACLYGEEENDSLCRRMDPNRIHRIALGGGHHFDGDYQAVAEVILKQAGLH